MCATAIGMVNVVVLMTTFYMYAFGNAQGLEISLLNVTVTLGRNVTFYCNASGSGNLSYSWGREGGFDNSTVSRWTGEDTSLLTIMNVGVADGGVYVCSVSDNETLESQTATETATLLTEGPKFVTELPPEVNITIRTSLTLTCSAINNMDAPNDLMFQWFFNDVSIDSDPQARMIDSSGEDANRISTSSLTVFNVNVDDTGNYDCKAYNRELDDSIITSTEVIVSCPEGSSPDNDSICTCKTGFSREDVNDTAAPCNQCDLAFMPITDGERLTDCEPCPSGSSRRDLSEIECTCRLESRIASQSESTDTQCEPCPTGSSRLNFTDKDCTCFLDYFPVIMEGILERCDTCPSGSRRMSVDVSDCTCGLEYFQNAETSECDPCPAGSRKINEEDEECTCENQYYPNRTDLLACVPCPLNSWRLNPEDDNCTCSANSITESETDTTTNEPCSKCALDFYPIEYGNETICEPCEMGSMRFNVTETICTCDSDHYEDDNGMCLPCPPGSSREPHSALNCTCERSYFRDEDSDNLTCILCPMGSIRMDRNTVKCECEPQLLLQGDQQNRTLECVPCPEGSTMLNPSDEFCTCLGNSVTAGGASQTTADPCTNCSEGYTQSTQLSTAGCDMCSDGYYQTDRSNSGFPNCEPCPPNSHRNNSEAFNILECECNKGFIRANDTTGDYCLLVQHNETIAAPDSDSSIQKKIIPSVSASTVTLAAILVVTLCIIKWRLKRNFILVPYSDRVDLDFEPVNAKQPLGDTESLLSDICKLEKEDFQASSGIKRRQSKTMEYRELESNDNQQEDEKSVDESASATDEQSTHVSEGSTEESFVSSSETELKPSSVKTTDKTNSMSKQVGDEMGNSNGEECDEQNASGNEMIGNVCRADDLDGENQASGEDQATKNKQAANSSEPHSYSQAGSAYDCINSYENPGSAYNEVGSYNQIEPYEQSIETYEQPCSYETVSSYERINHKEQVKQDDGT